jgi:plasmid stability protein
MANITIRNIPNSIFNKLKKLSLLEKRSLNSEILMILEKGISKELEHAESTTMTISRDTQIDLWEKISGQWEDNRSTQEIVTDIYNSRTLSRDISL